MFFFGIPLFNIKLTVDLYETKVSGDRFTPADPGYMRDTIWWLSEVTKVHLWFIMIITANYFVMPKQIGLNFKFNVATVADDTIDEYRGAITASKWSTGHLRYM